MALVVVLSALIATVAVTTGGEELLTKSKGGDQCDADGCRAKILLNNGVSMPAVGLGTAGYTDQNLVISAIDTALEAGYRMIDTADLYNNHRQLAEALNTKLLDKHGLKREDIFIITKLRPVDLGFDRQSVQL